MKKLNINEICSMLKTLQETYNQLLEDKYHMLSTCEFDCAEDEFEFDCICDDLKETEKAIDKLSEMLHSDDIIIDGDDLYYTDDEDELGFDIF